MNTAILAITGNDYRDTIDYWVEVVGTEDCLAWSEVGSVSQALDRADEFLVTHGYSREGRPWMFSRKEDQFEVTVRTIDEAMEGLHSERIT